MTLLSHRTAYRNSLYILSESSEGDSEEANTGKMMKALFDLIDKDYFKKGSTIIALHTGGLQGVMRDES